MLARTSSLVLAAAAVVAALIGGCTGGGGDGGGDPEDAGVVEDVADAGNNADATPVFTDEFVDIGAEWTKWTCALLDFQIGRAVQGEGVGTMVPVNQSRMDCGVEDAQLVDIDVMFDFAFVAESTGFPGDPVAANESVILSARRHLISGAQPWLADELDAVIVPTAADTASARFITALPADQGDSAPLALSAIEGSEASIGLSLLDDTAPVRARIRIDELAPTRLRLKLWQASAAEPSEWLVDATLDIDGDVVEDDFGFAISVAYDSSTADAVPVQFDNVVAYDAATVSADQPLPPL